jgi:hypothetical protein
MASPRLTNQALTATSVCGRVPAAEHRELPATLGPLSPGVCFVRPQSLPDKDARESAHRRNPAQQKQFGKDQKGRHRTLSLENLVFKVLPNLPNLPF